VRLFFQNRESARLKKLEKQFTLIDRNMLPSDEVLRQLETIMNKVSSFQPSNELQAKQKERIEDTMFKRCQMHLQETRKQHKKVDTER
jgi:hypothetical protein